MTKPIITVVIPAYNEAGLLPRCLAALLPQAKAIGAEVIVVDNGSTDGTAEVARLTGLSVVSEPRHGVVYALQSGLQRARADIVAFTDADSMVDPDWLKIIIAAFTDTQVAAITGPFRFDRLRFLSWFRIFYRRSLVGCNMAVRREAALAVGGFNPRFNLGSDIMLGWALAQRGHLAYQSRMRVTTSARRFQARPYREGWRYVLNQLWLSFFHRPLFWHFPPIRQSPEELARRERQRLWIITGVSTAAVLLYLSLWPTATDFHRISVRGQTHQKIVALTFDDGPGAGTRPIVDILTAKKVPAIFFEVGRSVLADPAEARYVADHGFPIGNHSWSHSFRLPYFSPKHIAAELTDTSAAIRHATGVQTTYFRPPHGFRSPQLLYEANRLHLRLVDWTVDPRDYYTSDVRKLVRDVVEDVRPGSIILLHDGLQDGPRTKTLRERRPTIAALPQIIDTLRQRGYTFVSLDTLLAKTKRREEPSKIRLFFRNVLSRALSTVDQS